MPMTLTEALAVVAMGPAASIDKATYLAATVAVAATARKVAERDAKPPKKVRKAKSPISECTLKEGELTCPLHHNGKGPVYLHFEVMGTMRMKRLMEGGGYYFNARCPECGTDYKVKASARKD